MNEKIIFEDLGFKSTPSLLLVSRRKQFSYLVQVFPGCNLNKITINTGKIRKRFHLDALSLAKDRLKKLNKYNPQIFHPRNQNGALLSRYHNFVFIPNKYQWIAHNCVRLPAMCAGHLKTLQADPWPEPPAQTSSFLPSCLSRLYIPLFIRGLLIFVFFFPGFVLSLLFFHLVDQFWEHLPLKALSCLAKTPSPSHPASISSCTPIFPS